MNCLCLKRSTKTTMMVAEGMYDKYVGMFIHIESMLTSLCVKDVAELPNFSTQPSSNYILRGDDVNECSFVGTGRK